MLNLTQMLMQKWGRTAVRQATNRHALLLTTSAMMAMLLVGCGGSSSDDDPAVEENHAPLVVNDGSELSYNEQNTYDIIISATDADDDSLSIVFTELGDFNLMHGEQSVAKNVSIDMDQDSENSFSVTLVHSELSGEAPTHEIIHTLDFYVKDGEVDSESATYTLIIQAPAPALDDVHLMQAVFDDALGSIESLDTTMDQDAFVEALKSLGNKYNSETQQALFSLEDGGSLVVALETDDSGNDMVFAGIFNSSGEISSYLILTFDGGSIVVVDADDDGSVADLESEPESGGLDPENAKGSFEFTMQQLFSYLEGRAEYDENSLTFEQLKNILGGEWKGDITVSYPNLKNGMNYISEGYRSNVKLSQNEEEQIFVDFWFGIQANSSSNESDQEIYAIDEDRYAEIISGLGNDEIDFVYCAEEDC